MTTGELVTEARSKDLFMPAAKITFLYDLVNTELQEADYENVIEISMICAIFGPIHSIDSDCFKGIERISVKCLTESACDRKGYADAFDCWLNNSQLPFVTDQETRMWVEIALDYHFELQQIVSEYSEGEDNIIFGSPGIEFLRVLQQFGPKKLINHH
ncbi:hypothetical protein G210_4508 [Candida maltosa Xu316]|uniref:Uncharacterized protein n=1 Tax=Candida maltosa (strain Xu316) TaxID=1245528 RepID=M3JRB3_CANMX|nr:hypothetical protein G210_4508 [Candida maltosa Xu316]